MLYQEKPIGQRSLVRRIFAGLAMAFTPRRYDDFDLLEHNQHLRRDIGLDGDSVRK